MIFIRSSIVDLKYIDHLNLYDLNLDHLFGLDHVNIENNTSSKQDDH